MIDTNNLSEVPDAELADFYGRVDGEGKVWSALRERVRAEIVRRGRDAQGAAWGVELRQQERETWLSEKLKEELGRRLRYFRRITKAVVVVLRPVGAAPDAAGLSAMDFCRVREGAVDRAVL